MPAQEVQGHELEGSTVGASQVNTGSHAELPGLEPAGGAEAPPISRSQAREVERRGRRAEIIASETGKFKELPRRLDADRVRSVIGRARVAAAVTEETRHRARSARFKRAAKDVHRRLHPSVDPHGLLSIPALARISALGPTMIPNCC